jgi:hypothetical protein
MGALGGEWALGADGVEEPAQTKEAALEALALSANAERKNAGHGLATFMKRASDTSGARALVFVPGKPGPWLDGVMKAAAEVVSDASGRAPFEFIVCTDGVTKTRPNKDDASDATVASDDLSRVVSTLGRLRARIIVIDRRDGRVHSNLGGNEQRVPPR